jgi:DNA-binding IclR family transcriptional regulator
MCNKLILKVTRAEKQAEIIEKVEANGFALLVALARRASTQGTLEISNADLAQEAGFKAKSTIVNIREKLENAGFVEYTTQGTRGIGSYQLRAI